MSTLEIFSRDIGTTNYAVWVTNGIVQYSIGGEIRTGITSVSEFLEAAATAINRPNSTDDSVLTRFGAISDEALENYENGMVGFDAGGGNTNPSIGTFDDKTAVSIGGAGVGGTFRVDFGSGVRAEEEAVEFLAFAEDLLGKATATGLEVKTGIQIGDFTRGVTISERDDDIRQVKFGQSKDQRDKSVTDRVVEDLAAELGGVRLTDGNVSESYTANQLRFGKTDDTVVNLGSQGVGGSEAWDFATEADAQSFFDAIKTTFQPSADRRDFVDAVIESLAEDLGATQVRDGKVSWSYEARQIKLIDTEDGYLVDLGNHKVGGKERYDFGAELDDALTFIDQVRDAVGVGAKVGGIVDEFTFKVSGGAGISGSPTFVGKDDFVEFIGGEFGGTQTRDGRVSESFGGGGRLQEIGGDTLDPDYQVVLGPRGVGGKEVWVFDTELAATGFLETMDDLFA